MYALEGGASVGVISMQRPKGANTMLMRFDPFRDFDALAQALAAPGVGRSKAMPMDAYRDGDRVVIHLDLPGVDPESIDLTVDRNVLTVTAERKWEPSERQDVIVAERPQGRF